MSEYFHYISTGDYNFNISLLQIPDAISLFDDIDQHISDINNHLNALPDLTMKDATYLIGIFMIISQRQMRNAFFLFLRRMSYDGMLLFRVGLESAVFSYRIFKEPQLSMVWTSKNENWKEFLKSFSNKKEFPDDMPFRDDIKKQIDLLNEYWAHPNINFFSRSLVFPKKEQQINDKKIMVPCFDDNEDKYLCYLFDLLDCCIKIVAIYRNIFEKKFEVLITSTEAKYFKIIDDFKELKIKFGIIEKSL
jgi:hypothetical protein